MERGMEGVGQCGLVLWLISCFMLALPLRKHSAQMLKDGIIWFKKTITLLQGHAVKFQGLTSAAVCGADEIKMDLLYYTYTPDSYSLRLLLTQKAWDFSNMRNTCKPSQRDYCHSCNCINYFSHFLYFQVSNFDEQINVGHWVCSLYVCT